MIGRVTAVKEVRLGGELASAAIATATSLDLISTVNFNGDGGQLEIGDEVWGYEVVGDSLELDGPLVDPYDAETPVYLSPATYERTAFVQAVDQEEEVVARVPHALYALLPAGIREDDETAEAVEAELVDGELVVADVLGREPTIQGGFVDASRQSFASVGGVALDAGFEAIPMVVGYDSGIPIIETYAEAAPEIDCVAKVDWGAMVRIHNDGGGFRIEGIAIMTLAVDGVPFGIERRTGLVGKFDPTGPTPEYFHTLADSIEVPMVAGVTYQLSILARFDHPVDGTPSVGGAEIMGDKGGVGLSYSFGS
jgi:hypothetical protein